MHTPPFLLGGEGGGFDRTSIFFLGGGGLVGKRRANFSRDGVGGWGGCNFYIKDELKSEIFNGKKVHKQKCFFLS